MRRCVFSLQKTRRFMLHTKPGISTDRGPHCLDGLVASRLDGQVSVTWSLSKANSFHNAELVFSRLFRPIAQKCGQYFDSLCGRAEIVNSVEC